MLLWPCFLGLALAGGSLFDYLIFLGGTIAMRSAGCVINDLADRKLDAKVRRTKTRPLAAKQLTVTQALGATAFFMSIGFVAWLYLSQAAQLVSMLGALMMVVYPFAKRITNWPQVFLGLTFNLGLLVAIAHTGSFSWRILSLYASLVLWTIFYDTIYAFADLTDDLKIGIKSTAIVMQHAPKIWLTGCNALVHALLLVFLSNEGAYCLIPLGCGLLYLQSRLLHWQVTDPQSCIKTFGDCHFWGLGLWLWIELIRIITP